MKNIIFEQKGMVAVLRFNRPEALNALNAATLDELEDVLDLLERASDIRALIITGSGRSFVAGADISEMPAYSALDGRAFGARGNALFMRIENLPMPVIAAVNGFALGGGCELALSCDIRLAGTKAKLGLPETGLGIIPGFGGTQRLPRVVGPSKAMELIFTAQPVTAQRALEIGLVDRVVPDELLMETAFELAGIISANAPVAVREAKRSLCKGLQCDIVTGTALEVEALGLCFSSEDHKEGVSAFLQKRPHEPYRNC